MRADANVANGSVVKSTPDTINGLLVDFEVQIDIDTNYITYANDSPTLVIMFENIVTSSGSLSCEGVTGITNITSC